jgi:hypothetical protein
MPKAAGYHLQETARFASDVVPPTRAGRGPDNHIFKLTWRARFDDTVRHEDFRPAVTAVDHHFNRIAFHAEDNFRIRSGQ